MSSKITFAKRNNILVHISEVNSGLSDCICMKCNGKLVARKGLINDHHFAHQNADCGISFETQIHLATKEILKKEGKINLPDYNDSFIYKSENVELEKKFDRIIADVFIKNIQEEIIIEIAVTNFCTQNKIDKIKEINISTLEIDLSKIDRDIDLEKLQQIVIESLYVKKWIFKKIDYTLETDYGVSDITSLISDKNETPTAASSNNGGGGVLGFFAVIIALIIFFWPKDKKRKK